jgi:nucleoside-diphosphate-sugar epimerase
MTTILITGSNGFIGASFAKRVRARQWRVLGVDLQPTDLTGCCDEYRQIDLGTPEALRSLCALSSPEVILHAGGISGFMVETDNPTRIGAVNIAGTMSVLELARRSAVRRTVICSSIMAYGPDRVPNSLRVESEYPEPISVYGASKVAAEALMHAYRGQYGIDTIALRFGHVYGPGRTTQCFIRDMLAAVRTQQPCRIPHASKSLRQYVYIDDICRSIDLALAVPAPATRVINVTAGELHTLREVQAAIARQYGALQVSFGDDVDLPNYRIGMLDLSRASADLGFRPRFPLAVGIQDYWSKFDMSDVTSNSIM